MVTQWEKNYFMKNSINLLNKAGQKYCMFKESIILTKLSTSIVHQLLLYTVY